MARFDVVSYYESMDHVLLLNSLRQAGIGGDLGAIVSDYLALPDKPGDAKQTPTPPPLFGFVIYISCPPTGGGGGNKLKAPLQILGWDEWVNYCRHPTDHH